MEMEQVLIGYYKTRFSFVQILTQLLLNKLL